MDLVWVGFGAFFVVSLTVGVRLVALAGRTRRVPELLIGLGVLGIGPVGFGLQTLAGLVKGYELAETLAATGAFATAIGIWAKLAFNWLVYRRESRFAALATGALALTVAVHLLAQPVLGSFTDATESIPLMAMRGALQSIALAWGSAEAFAYWGRLRKRARIGLADPVLVNRFLMWAISAGAAGFGTAIGVAASVAWNASPLQLPAIVASSSAHGFVAALGMWLAFAPPRAYVAWLSGGRAAA
jgi:hypothetical protein